MASCHIIFPGFSLNSYLAEKGLDPATTTKLSIHLASQLFHDIGVASALLETQCDRTILPYHPSAEEVGWNKGKGLYIHSKLSSEMAVMPVVF